MTLNCRLNFRDNKVESVTSPIGGDSLLYRQLVEKYGEEDGLDMMYIAASEDAMASLSNYLNEQGEPTLQALERYVEAINIENKGEITLDDRSLIKTLGASLNTSSLRTVSESLLRIAETGVNDTLLDITPQEALDLHHRIQNTEGDIYLPEVGPNSIISEGEVKTIDEILEPHLVEVNTREEFDEVVNEYAPQEFLDEYNSETPMSPAEEMAVIKDFESNIKNIHLYRTDRTKSATDNVGTFSSESNDIRYQVTGEQDTQNLDQVSKDFNEVVNQLNRVFPNTKVHQLNSEQIDNKLKELGVSENVRKQVVAWHGTVKNIEDNRLSVGSSKNFGELLSGLYFGERRVSQSFAGITPFGDIQETSKIFKVKIDDSTFPVIDMRGESPTSDEALQNILSQKEYEDLLNKKRRGEIKGIRLINAVEHLYGESSSPTQYVVFDESVIDNIKVYEGELLRSIVDPLFQKGIEVTVNGFVHNGEVYLNTDNLNPETPIHEFSHIYNSWLKDNRPHTYQRGIELINEELAKENSEIKSVIDYVKETQPNLKGESLSEEILAQLIGERGVELINSNKKGGIVEWIKDVWNEIRNLLGLSSLSTEQVANLTVQDFAEMAATDLLRGERLTSEMESIKERAIADGTFMKAPNGEDSNLTERQWLQVRTENFKRWFGDWQNSPESASKILDENGEPLVVYHGTDRTFSEFIANYAEGWGTGMYFTDNSAQASQEFGNNVIGAFLKITKPFDGSLNKIRKEIETTTIYNEYIEEGWNELTDSEKEGDYDDNIEDYRNDTNRMAEFIESYEEGDNTDSVNDALKELGYDGIVAEDSNSIDGLEIVAFESNQIKSATDNTGDFSSETGNIYKQVDGVTQTPNGFVHDGKVYINSDKAGLDTPIHEFGHLWNAFIKRDSPEVYRRGLELVEGTEYLRDVENNPAYDNLNKEQKLEEALAQAIGEKGAKIENETKRNTFVEWINELFDKVANALGIRGLSSKELSEISLDEYTSLVSAELLSGRPIQGNAELFSSTSKNMPKVSGVKVFKKADTEINYRDASNHIVLELIQTPQEARGEGQAQSAMNDLVAYADQTRKPIYLDVVPRDSETNESRLRAFCERNGFTFDDSMTGPGSGIPGTSMVRYPKRVTRTEGTMADIMFQRHMETSVVRHYNSDMTPATEPNMMTEMLETLDTNKANRLIGELRAVYEKPTRSINKVDVDAIIEAGIEAGVNLSDMNEVLANKGQTSLQDLAGSLMYLVESPSNDTLEATTELYTELLPNKVKEKVTRERLEGTDTEVIVFDGHVDKRQAFEEASLIEVGDGIYKRVEAIEDSDVARRLYDDFTDNLSSKVSQEMITDSKKHMTRAQLVEHVMNKPRAESEMHLRRFYESLGEEYTDRQIKLHQMLNDNVVRERPLVREVVSERTIVADQQSVDKFHENKLKNSIKNNAKYRSIYRHLVVTSHGLTLTPTGERRIGEIVEAIQTLPISERNVLMDAISQSRASNVKALLIQDNTTPVTLDSIVTNAQNNIESLKEFDGIYEIADGRLTTKEGGDMLLRVKDRLFLKDNDNGTESTYKEINVYNEGDIVVDNVLDSIRDPRYLGNTSQESENNTTYKNQENKIKEKEC